MYICFVVSLLPCRIILFNPVVVLWNFELIIIVPAIIGYSLTIRGAIYAKDAVTISVARCQTLIHTHASPMHLIKKKKRGEVLRIDIASTKERQRSVRISRLLVT